MSRTKELVTELVQLNRVTQATKTNLRAIESELVAAQSQVASYEARQEAIMAELSRLLEGQHVNPAGAINNAVGAANAHAQVIPPATPAPAQQQQQQQPPAVTPPNPAATQASQLPIGILSEQFGMSVATLGIFNRSGFSTVGDLVGYLKTAQLTDLPGLGKTKASNVADAYERMLDSIQAGGLEAIQQPSPAGGVGDVAGMSTPEDPLGLAGSEWP